MYQPILQALSKGFKSKQIIDYILRKFPREGDKIQKALTAGFTADQVVKYLGGGKKALNQFMSSPQNQEINTEHARTLEKNLENQKFRNKVVTAGAAAATLPLTASMASTALSRALPTNLLGLAQNTPISQQSIQQTQPSPVNISQPNVSQPNVSQQQALPQTRNTQINIDRIKNLGEETRIKNLIEGGMSPPDIAAFLKKILPKDKYKALEASEGGIEATIEDYANGLQQPVAQETTVTSPLSEQTAEATIPEMPKEEDKFEVKPITKNQVVASPYGVGEVKEIRNGKAIIDVDGRKHQVDAENLEKEPEKIDELYDRLFEAIPEQYKSRMMNFAGYDEEANELIFRPHGGAAYVYKEIPPEFAEDLKNRLHSAKTTGKNMYGIWNEGDQSYGAGMSALIKKLQAQYGGKGKEYVRKYITLFDILGVPHEAKKRREEEARRKHKGNG